MDETPQFASYSITNTLDLSWVFVVDWILALVLSIWVIFHFNRLMGFVISWSLENTLWRHGQIKIDVQSVKLSLLGGRLFFKNLTIIDKDYTVAVVQGTFTWRYWLPNVRYTHRDLVESQPEGDLLTNSKLPCRFYLHMRGAEIFLYNRTVSYDTILEQLSTQTKNTDEDSKSPLQEKECVQVQSPISSETTEVGPKALPSLSFITKFFPIQIKINKGALVAGNRTTQAVLIASYTQCDGVADLHTADNPLDLGRIVQEMEFKELKLMLKPNILYEGPIEQGRRSKKRPKLTRKRWVLLRQFIKVWNVAFRRRNKDGSFELWRGLSQYLDEEEGSISEVQHTYHEYAKYTTLLTSEMCKFNYYYDIPGLVPSDAQHTQSPDDIDIGNGGDSPKFGMDMELSQATIHYGPWADRQRRSLHQVFLPSICLDATPQRKLAPGELRKYTEFQFNLEFLDDCIIRVPFREISKNEEFMEANRDVDDPLRPFGWIEIKCTTGSLLALRAAQVASKSGYNNRFDLKLQGCEVRSSVNHDILLRCQRHSVCSDIGYPLSWNGLAAWSFVNTSSNLEMFLLREHITLISDMFSDFGMGPTTPYELFRPFTYEFIWKVLDYKLYFNINDANIVNNPLDFNDNCYMSIQGDELNIKVHVPMDVIVKSCSIVDYSIDTPKFSLIIDTPPWHMLNNFLKHREVGRSQDFRVEGSYTYYSEVGLDLVDSVIIACTGKYVGLQCYGFVMKYIMGIKENYFGDFTSFRTLEEYTNAQQYHDEGTVSSDPVSVDARKLRRIENETDVHFSFCVEESCIVIPYNLYDCHSNMLLHLSYLDLDIRFTNYYMDLQADVSPLKGYYKTDCDQESLLDIGGFVAPEKDDFFIDGLSIHGHRAFGLPPDEPTFFCKWDITPGQILFDSTTDVLSGLVKAIEMIAYGYKNFENHLTMVEPELFDTTQLTVAVPGIKLTVRSANAQHALIFELDDVVFKSIDFTNPRFIKKASVDVGEARVVLQDVESKKFYVDIGTALRFTNFKENMDYNNVRQKQNDHVIRHDCPFHRAPFFVDEESKARYNQMYGVIVPSLPIPDISPPLTKETIDMIFDDLVISDTIGLDGEEFTPSNETENFIQDFDSEFLQSSHYPYAKILKKNFRETLAGSKIKPSLDYEDSEFRPLKDSDPEFDTSNLIFNVGVVDANISVESLPIILDYVESLLRMSFKDCMDDLQVSVLKTLYKEFDVTNAWDNVRFVSPNISILLTEKSWSDDPLEEDNIEHVEVQVESPSLAASFKKPSKGIDEDTVAMHILTLRACVKNSLQGPIPLTIKLSDIEFWSHILNESSTSVSLGAFTMDIDSESIPCLASSIQKLIGHVNSFTKRLNLIIDNHYKARIELMYQIATATDKFKINHDPAVITRPSYIVRLSKNHIRNEDSWKIIARLRHILTNAPRNWYDQQTKKFLSSEFEAPASVWDEVLAVFSEWRSWELRDPATSYVFKYIFADFPLKPLKSGLFKLSVENTSVNLLAPDGQVNYVCADFLDISGHKVVTSVSSVQLSDSLSLRVSRFKGQLGLLLHDLLPLLDIRAPSSEAQDKNIGERLSEFHCVMLLEDVDFKVMLPKTSVNIVSSDVELAFLLVTSQDGPDINVTCGSKYFEFDISSDNATCVNYSLTRFNASAASTGNLVTGSKVLRVNSDDAVFTVGHGTNSCVELLTNLSDDLITFKSKDWSRLSSSQTKGKTFTPPDTHILINSKRFGWTVSIIDPLKSSGIIDNGSLELILQDGILFSSISSSIVSFEVKTLPYEEKYFAISHHGSQLFAKYDLESKSMEIDWDYQLTQVVFTELLSNIKSIKHSISEAIDSFEILKTSARSLAGGEVKRSMSDSESQKIPIIFKRMAVSGLVLSLVFNVGLETYTLELHKILLTWHDIIFGTKKPYGDVEIANTKLKIDSNDVPALSSSVMDVSLSVKVVLNPETDRQALQIESEHFHILLHPITIAKMMQLTHDVRYILNELGVSMEKIETSAKEKPEKEPVLPFSSMHMLSYNFCVGVIFDEPTKDYPGLIVGCDKMFFITEDSLGKFSLISAYISIAKGMDLDNFFSSGEEFQSGNRAFLPNMQIAYSNAQNKDVIVRVTGEQFDVKFSSSSVAAFERFLKTISTLERLKKNVKRRFIQEESISSPSEAYKLPSHFSSVQCIMNFAGGAIELYGDDFGHPDDVFGSSFKIKTPGVEIITDYTKTAGPKDHNIDIEVLTFSSSNTLLVECVPVLDSVIHGFKNMSKIFKQSSMEKEATSGSSIDIEEILNRCHIAFCLRIDRQELILSCEPSAKVQAVVGMDCIDLRLVTDDEHPTQPVSGALAISNVGASVQHTYSREISASVTVDELLWSLLMSKDKELKIFSGVKVNSIQSYLNLKQLQDVNLFKDLWLIKQQTNNGSATSMKSAVSNAEGEEENLAVMFQKAYGTSPIPWTVDILVVDANLKVDLGPSLGLLSLELDRAWAVSRKKSIREQDLLVGLDTLALKSKGRLDGFLDVKNIRFSSVIQWSMVGDNQTMPLLFLSSGFDGIETKISFDYNVFFMGKVQNFFISVFNQVDKHKILNDKLAASTECGSIEIFTTAFAASNVMDIYNTLVRIRQDNKRSYKEDMNKVIVKGEKNKNSDIIDIIATLTTEINVNFGKTIVQVYPSSLLDSQVLIFDLGGLRIHFGQHLSQRTLISNLNMKLLDINIALSSHKTQLPEEMLVTMSIDSFISHAIEARGGGIFIFPSWECVMETWSKPNSNEIEYSYRSQFGGKVDIRWNLGSINFIREMWTMHARAFSSRLRLSEDSVPLIGDENIEEKIKAAGVDDKYHYTPLTIPIIEAPQLRDLGDATPPLEWFGLHRKSFPALTHQYAIIGLQKLVHEVEMQYGRVLGNVD